MANLIEDLWNGYVLQESAKVQQRLGVTQQQQQALNTPPVPSNPQAKAGSVPGGFGLTQKQMFIGGGVIAAGIMAYLAFK